MNNSLGTVPLNLEQIKDLRDIAQNNNKTDIYIDILMEWAEGAMAELARLKQTKNCQHSIVDARNDVIKSGYTCTKCNAVFAAG